MSPPPRPTCAACGDPAGGLLDERWLCIECLRELTDGVMPELRHPRPRYSRTQTVDARADGRKARNRKRPARKKTP